MASSWISSLTSIHNFPGPSLFPQLLPGLSPCSLPLASPPYPAPLLPPGHLEQLLKQEMFPPAAKQGPSPLDLYTPGPGAGPFELLARSGMFYQNFPNFAGKLSLCLWQWHLIFTLSSSRLSSFFTRQDSSAPYSLHLAAASGAWETIQTEQISVQT